MYSIVLFHQSATPGAESKQENGYTWDTLYESIGTAPFTPNTNMFVSIIIAVMRMSQPVRNVGHVFP